jgi:hypothetical protein
VPAATVIPSDSASNRRKASSADILAGLISVQPVSAKNLLTDPVTGLRARTTSALIALRMGGRSDEAARWVSQFHAAATLNDGAGPLMAQLQPKAIADAGEDCARQAFLLNPNSVTAKRLASELWLEAGRAELTALALEAEYGLRPA